MDTVFARYASRPAPRYTSYPTAPHFQKDFAETRYRDWLSKLDRSAGSAQRTSQPNDLKDWPNWLIEPP